jgi:peroxiredoxin
LVIRTKILAGLCLALIVFSPVWGMGQRPKANAAQDESLAADFVLPDLAGKNVKLSDFQGKVVLLNFWASWCPPCRSEMPGLQKLFEKLKGSNFQMLAVSLDRDPRAARAIIKEYGYTFPVLLAPGDKVAEHYKIGAIPTTFIIDKQGRIASRTVGAADWPGGKIIKELKKLSGE